MPLGSDRPPMPPDVEARFFGDKNPPPPDPDAPAPEKTGPPVRVAFPPHFFPPVYGSQPLYQIGSASIAGTGVNPVPWTVPASLVFKCPSAFVAIVRVFGMTVLNMLAGSVIQTVLRFNAAPQAPVRQMPAQPAAFAGQTWDTVAYVSPPGAVIDVLATVNDNATYTVTAFYEGWLVARDQWAKFIAGF